MSLANVIKAYGAKWLTSRTRVRLARARAELARRIARKPHTVYYFHRADDPYCQLMVQVLPDIASRFAVELKPLVVEKLPANMYPDPARYEAYSIIDASRLARLYGLGFSPDATVPDRLAVGMANRYLASRQDDPAFFSLAAEVGAALWHRDLNAVRNICGLADVGEKTLEANEKKLRELGHYASASLYYAGEFYVGIDRLDHLERRFNDVGIGDEQVEFEVHRLWRYGLDEMDRSIAGQSIDVFFSVRSPFSYVGVELVSELAEKAGVALNIMPVLPMMMRSMKVPRAKGRYIVTDTTREAYIEGVEFGTICDPLGTATWRAMGIGFALMDDEQSGTGRPGQALMFFRSFMAGVWSQGIDGTTDKGLTKVLKNAGLDDSWINKAIPKEQVEKRATANREDMFRSGSWGVPTFRAGGQTFWGQDRMWAIVEALKQ